MRVRKGRGLMGSRRRFWLWWSKIASVGKRTYVSKKKILGERCVVGRGR
jgi:hypothetical protein